MNIVLDNEIVVKPDAKVSIYTKLLIVIFVVFVGFTAYTSFKKAELEKEFAILNAEKSVLNEKLQDFQRDKVEEISTALTALEAVKLKNVKWSEAISLILQATPKDIFYKSFSGNGEGAVTITGTAPSFSRVGALIEVLKKKPFISSVFVSNALKGTNPSNASLYNFSLTVLYAK